MASQYGALLGMIRFSLPAICLIISCLTEGSESVEYQSLGCWRDTSNRAIPTLEGTDPRLDNSYYPARNNPIEKCYQVALSRGFTVFAVQNGGWCAGSADAQNTYNKYGPSTACAADGEGGPWANEVYLITGSESVEYQSLGCWRDTSNRAIPTLEGTDPRLDNSYYPARNNPIEKCYQVALSRGFTMFAVQDDGQCFGSADAQNIYNKYGPSTACAADGEGGPWANEVYLITGSESVEYQSLGCWRDTSNRAIPTLEGTDPRLDNSYYPARNNPIEKCYQVALSRGFTMFAVQDDGQCFGSADAQNTYNKYGPSTACAADGEGGPWANEVYLITGSESVEYQSLGCWRDTSNRAIPTLEGTDPRLDNSYYPARNNPIEKCYQVALSRGFTVFAVQDDGQCFGSADAQNTYNKYGPSTACAADGEGGPWANEVYMIKATGTPDVTRRVCEGQSLNLECALGQMIQVTYALYGRTTPAFCSGPVSTTNCGSSTSLSTVRNYCEGRRTCMVRASNSVFGDPCRRTAKYLEVTYRCIGHA